MQLLSERLDSSSGHRLSAWGEFENANRAGSTGIRKHLAELGKEYSEQGLNLIFVASRFIGQLRMQAHQLPVCGNQFAGNIATTGVSTEQDPGDRGGVQFVRLGSQSAS